MPWTKKDYPDSMKNLPAAVRNKAVEIANALVKEEGMDDGIAIATAISRAKDWAENRGKEFEQPQRSKISDVKKHGRDRYVIPHKDQWAVKVEGSSRAQRIYRSKTEAVSQAKRAARADHATLTIQRKTGAVETRISYNPTKRAKKTGRKKTKSK
jgi:uncharacterized protein YdaT